MSLVKQDRVGELWTDGERVGFYLVVGKISDPSVMDGYVWHAHALYEHGYEGRLRIGRNVYISEQHLLDYMRQVL